MTATLLPATDHRRMAWKNGGGETAEIAIHPAGAALDAFEWRVSMATVTVDGPFSGFTGVDRTLVVLEGDGLTLDIVGERRRLGAGDPPLAFAADVATAATLAESPITDLNVMTRRDRFAHLVERIDGARDVTVAAGAMLLLFGDGLAIETGDAAFELGYRDCLRIDGPADVHISRAPDAGALLIRIWPV